MANSDRESVALQLSTIIPTMDPNTSLALQLINQRKEFNIQALQKSVDRLGDCGKDYYTTAIIGAQNTGKSTLMNHLFGTDFSVLKGQAGRRTTRGVIVSKDSSANILVMDVQGNDSYETHTQGDQNYEKMVSSFALIGANALIVNIFEKQLGQHSGSQYETLKTVMRMCINQFKQQSPKTILFCLRDSNPNYTDQGQCKRTIESDVKKVWKSVWEGTKRSQQFAKYQNTPQRFFTLEVAFLREFDPDYPEEFQEDCQNLKKRFQDPTNEMYLFRKQSKQYNLPCQDLPPLLQKLWVKLVQNQQLNLPGEKAQLVNYRCQAVAALIKQRLQEELKTRKGQVLNYGDLLNQLKIGFRQQTSRYSKNIIQKWQKQLEERLLPRIRTAVYDLVQELQAKTQQKFSGQMQDLFYDPEQSFKAQAHKVQQSTIKHQIQLYKLINFELQDRKERIDKLRTKLKQHVDAAVANKQQWTKKQFQNNGQRVMRLVAANSVKQGFNITFYETLRNNYDEQSHQLLRELRQRLFWSRDSQASASQLDSAQIQLMTWLRSQLIKQFQNSIGQKLISYFGKLFKEDASGTRYEHNLLTQQKTIQLYTNAKEEAVKLLTFLNNYQLRMISRASMIIIDDQPDQKGQNQDLLLDSSAVLTLLEQFQRQASQQYRQVVRRRTEAQNRKVPLVLILLIVFFIYDDVWFTHQQSPFMHYLMIFIAVAVGLLYATGQGPVVKELTEMLFEKANRVTGTLKDKVISLKGKAKKKQQ